MREKLIDVLTKAVWDQMETLLVFVEPDPVAEIMLFAYFKDLRLSSLFGSTFIKEAKPVNLACFGSSFALIEPDPAHDRSFYPYLVIRERAPKGLAYTYVFPYDNWDGSMQVDVTEIVLDNESARSDLLKSERLISDYATRWAESDTYEEDS